MSMASSISSTAPSSLNSDPTSQQRYTFIQHSDNVIASSTRQAVRSHAMSAVRRLHRQKNAKPMQLKWPEECPAGKTIGPTWPDGQSAGFDERSENEEPIEVQRRESEAMHNTPHPAVSETLSSADGQKSCLMDFASSKGPPSDRARPFCSSEMQDSQPYPSMGIDERITPIPDWPRTLLGAGRLDPFQTSSIHINRSLAELIDHCMLPCFHSRKAASH